MATDTSPTPENTDAPPRRRRVMRRVQVTRVAQLSPHMVRVTFTGDDLSGFVFKEMDSLLLDEPRLAADRLAALLAARGKAPPPAVARPV